MAVAIPLAALAITAAGTAYSISQASKAGKGMNLPTAADVPKTAQADTAALGISQQQAEKNAETAGGTIFSSRNQDAIGADPNGQRKSLLGT
jgi:hypothetical protein